MEEYTSPDYSKIALVTIDVQNDTMPGGSMEVKGTKEVLPEIIKLLALFRAQGRLVIHIVRLYEEDGTNVDLCRRRSIENGMKALITHSKGAQLVDGLAPEGVKLDSTRLLSGEVQRAGTNEYIMYKSRWGAFYKTPLEGFLRGNGITTLAFTGCNFPNCPRTSIYEASERDFKVVVVQDAISGIYEQGLNELRNIGCEMVGTHQLITKLKSATAH